MLSANGVDILISDAGDVTPTPAVSHAILRYNDRRTFGRADGIVITPSHNPPEDGGFKYDPPHGGPAEEQITAAIEARANEILAAGLKAVRRVPFERAMHAPGTRRHDFAGEYVDDLGAVIDFASVRSARLKLGVDPLGGASLAYWPRIADRYGLDLTVVNNAVDPTFRFMTVDWDGRIRTDPSSPYAMQRLIGLRDRFDIAFACDADADRHGVVTRSAGLLPPNHYLAVCVDYLFGARPAWQGAAVGKTIVSSNMIDRAGQRLGRGIYEVPVGFKWFVSGLQGGRLGFAGEESGGASLLRRDGAVWTTDKDGIAAALVSAEITARTGKDPGEIYRTLEQELGACFYSRVDMDAEPQQMAALRRISADDLDLTSLAGEKILRTLTTAPGNCRPIGGIKVIARDGWFAVRPSGTENICKIYAESFLSQRHLERIQDEGQRVASRAMTAQPAGVSR